MTRSIQGNNKVRPLIVAALAVGVFAAGPGVYSAYAQVFQSQFGGTGSGNGQFQSPVGDVIDGSNNIYVVDMDNSRVEKFDSSGTFKSQFGTSGSGTLDFPRGIAIDGSGNIWVTDTGNGRVVEFDSTGSYKAAYTSANGTFSNPNGISIDPSGNVWIADSGNNRIVEMDSLGTFLRQVTSANGTSFMSPQFVASDSSGNIWVSDTNHNRVVELSSTGAYKMQVGGCSSGACSQSGANGAFSAPEGIAFDTSGNLWVSDKFNNRAEEFNTSGVYQTQIGCGTGSCQGGTGNGSLSNPAGIALDPNNKIYVVDEGNNLVQVFQ